MKKYLPFIILLSLTGIVFAQDQTVSLPVTAENIQGLKLLQQQQQADINTQQQDIANDQNGIAVAQAAIAQDQVLMAAEQVTINQWYAAQAPVLITTAEGVNWDSFVVMSSQGDNWQTMQANTTGVNWYSIGQEERQAGVNWNTINANGGVNWPNWGTIKTNGISFIQWLLNGGQ